MCELLGMNCNVPTDILFSFEGFRARGGRTGPHTDGFGIGFFEERGCRLFLDTERSSLSAVADFVRRFPIRSRNVIAHIRKATMGPVALRNTQPYQRELWGRYWLFAHNGDLHGLPSADGGCYRPVGETDSEQAFCLLLGRLRAELGPDASPTAIAAIVADEACRLARLGTLNFLLSDGESLLARCATSLWWLVRESPFAEAHLVDEDVTVDFRELTAPGDRAAVVATAPLTRNEEWQAMRPGELLLFTGGRMSGLWPS